MGTFEDLGLEYSSVITLLGLFLAATAVFALLAIVFYVLKAAAVCDMSAKKGLKNPWYSFVPVVGAYAFGRLAGRKKSAWGAVLVILEIAYCVLTAAVAVTALLGWVDLIFAADKALAAGEELTASDFSVISRAQLPLLLMFPIMLARKVLNIICAWKIFAEFSGDRAVIYTILSVIFPVLMPIFLFSVRNNEPRGSKIRREAVGFDFE